MAYCSRPRDDEEERLREKVFSDYAKLQKEHVSLKSEFEAAARKHSSDYAKLRKEHVSLKSEAEEAARQQSSDYAKLQKKFEHLHSIIDTANLQAAGRSTHLTSAASKIQRQVRKFLAQQRRARVVADFARRCRFTRAVRAISRLQHQWRQRSQQRQCRWQAELDRKEPETPYDVILAFESLAEFLQKKEIHFLQKAESHLKVAEESRYRIVAVVGLFDKGKTWLVNKLFGVNLPSGKLCTTKGLSFLWIKERRMLVVDSAGVQSTVSYRSQAVDAIHDAQTTESMMFEMVSRISHQMLFVVNDLTWFEQKYVSMLHQKYVQCKQQKELIVVHNLRNTSVVQEAAALFKRQVMQCYDGEPSHMGNLIFTADAGEGAPPVHHVGLCYEFSSAGEAFNAKNREYLLQSLEHGNKLGSKMVLTDLLCSELSRLLPKFVNIETDPEKSCGQELSVKFVPCQDPSSTACKSHASLGSMRIQLPQEGASVTTKTRGVISPLGEIIAHDVSFDPIVNVFDKATETCMQRFIRIECPGVATDDIDWEELPNGVKISINKKPPIEEHSVLPVQPIRQHHGVWEREFLFDHSDGRFELCEEEADLENGVLTVVLKKSLQPRKGKLFGRARASGTASNGQATSNVPSESGSFDFVSSAAGA